MEEQKEVIMQAATVKEIVRSMRPSYFIQTKEGAYSGMIKHNLLNATRSSIGSSLSFTDLANQAAKLTSYTQQTGKSALAYFNLINGRENLAATEITTPKLSMFVPYPSQFKPQKNMLFTGVPHDHTEYLIAHRKQVKLGQSDYVALLKQLGSEIAVSPVEQVTIHCGKKKLGRAQRHALKAYSDLKMASELSGKVLLMPVMFAQADDFLGKLEPEVRDSLDGMMLFGGLQTMSLGAQFDSIRTLRASKGEVFVISIHENATPLEIAVMSLAGVDFFQTDYPLELAIEGKALVLSTEAREDDSQSQLVEHCSITGSVANDILSVALAAEQLMSNQNNIVMDISADEAKNRHSQEPIQAGCTCYTCANYSRSYLFHLQDVKEMNYYILLAIHNMHVNDQLFARLREHSASPAYVSGFLLRNFTGVSSQ